MHVVLWGKSQYVWWISKISDECERCFKGYENKVLKVVHGLMVVMKGIPHINLYPLMNETVTRDLTVGISESKYQTQHTRIWHMRLGHKLKKGLSVLGEKGLLKNMKKPCMKICEHCMYGKPRCLMISTSTKA